MAAEGSLSDRKRNKISKKKRGNNSEMSSAHVAEKEEQVYEATMKNGKSNKKRKSSADIADKTKSSTSGVPNSKDEIKQKSKNEKAKKLRTKREKTVKSSEAGYGEVVATVSYGVEAITTDEKCVASEPEPSKLLRKRPEKRRSDKKSNKADYESEQPYESECHMVNSGSHDDADMLKNSKTRKSKKSGKTKKTNLSPVQELTEDTLLEKREEDAAEDEVDEMSSGDEDNTKGMKKWITQYYQSRPGLKVLEERIDDFIMDHEAQEAKARAEREAQAAEGGWTVVVHHKGRKKTTDAESGVAVGSVAQAAVLDKMSKKKKKETSGLDFYRFQKREAHRNEIMMLQSKFEQDKKRIQQMRAARKFRPY